MAIFMAPISPLLVCALKNGEHVFPYLGSDFRMAEGVCDVGLDEAGLVAAIEAPAFEPVAVEPPAPAHLRHRIGQLDLAARARRLPVEMPEHVRLQDVAADDR